MTRLQRQTRIKELLAESIAMTQESVVESLACAGFKVTQATVSRDLAAIGAVRAANGYMLPQTGGIAASGDWKRLVSVIRDHVIQVQPAAALVVLQTAPGHANFVAAEIDAARPSEMVGCIAGDDTIFIATASNEFANELASMLKSALEGNG